MDNDPKKNYIFNKKKIKNNNNTFILKTLTWYFNFLWFSNWAFEKILLSFSFYLMFSFYLTILHKLLTYFDSLFSTFSIFLLIFFINHFKSFKIIFFFKLNSTTKLLRLLSLCCTNSLYILKITKSWKLKIISSFYKILSWFLLIWIKLIMLFWHLFIIMLSCWWSWMLIPSFENFLLN